MFFMEYLVEQPLIALFLCLGAGYLVGNIRVKSFSLGATAATLLVGLALGLLAKPVGGFKLDGTLQNCFYAMFAFTLGYDVGPAFFKALRSSGVRIVVLAVIHAVCTCGFIWLTCKIFRFPSDVGVGLLAGAFTTSAASGISSGEKASLVFSLTYSLGTVCAVAFVRFLAPKLLGIDLRKETKRHLDKTAAGGEQAAAASELIQVRALRICDGSSCAGKCVDEIEKGYGYRLEIETIARGSQRIPARQGEQLQTGDVLTVIGDISALSDFDDRGLEELSDPCHFQIRQTQAQIVLTTGADELILKRLTDYGIIIRSVIRDGKVLNPAAKVDLKEGDVLEVYGPEMAVEEVTKELGYRKDDGITTDIPFFSLAVAAGLAVASVSLVILGQKISLGVSFGALIVGLLCGWWYDRSPRFGHISPSTRWFIRSIGLNAFVAIAGLTSKLMAEDLVDPENLLYVAAGIVLAILVRAVVLLIGKYLLKLEPVDLLGGLCGSMTSTPALNALAEQTGSNAYALSYAPGYAVGNVLLILSGIILANIL